MSFSIKAIFNFNFEKNDCGGSWREELQTIPKIMRPVKVIF